MHNILLIVFPKSYKRKEFKTTNTFVSVKLLSDTYGIPKSTIYKAVKEDRLEYIQLGRSIRVSTDSIYRNNVQKDRDSSFFDREGEESQMTAQTTLPTGKGTIQKKKNRAGTIYYQVIKFPMYYNNDGSICYETSPCFKTREEAEEARTELIYKRKYAPRKKKTTKARSLPKQTKSLYDMFVEYLEVYVYPNFKTYSSVRTSTYALKKYCYPYMSKLTLETCEAVHLQKMINEMAKRVDASKIYQFVRRFFLWLKHEHVIEDNPAEYLTLPKHYPKKKQNRSPLSPEDQQKLRDYFKKNPKMAEKYEYVILLFLCTGIRPGELLGAERRNFDPTNKTLKIRKTVGYGFEPEIIKNTTKTPAGQRTVYLTTECVEAIQRSIKQNPESPWIRSAIRDPSRPMDHQVLESVLKRIGKAAGLSRPLFGYIFRHTFATNATRKGIPPTELCFLMGHTNASMINKIYANHNDQLVIKRYKNILDTLYD